MLIFSMPFIRSWIENTGRRLIKVEGKFVLVTKNNHSNPLPRPRFRRAVTQMIATEIQEERDWWKKQRRKGD